MDFDALGDGGITKTSTTDATFGTGDSPPGSGSYTVVDTTAPYVDLGAAPVVPGFVAGDDDETFEVTLPFPFQFYRVTYTTVFVSVNGYVSFATPLVGVAGADNQCPFTTGLPDATIAVFWDDLFGVTDISPNSTLVAAVAGTAPDRTYTVEWRGMDAFYVQGGNSWGQGVSLTQQLVLHENGQIDLHYGPRMPTVDFLNKDCGADRPRGCSATIGLEGAGGAPVNLVQCGTAAGPAPGFTPIDEGRLLQFTPQ